MKWLKGMVDRGLSATAQMWPPIRRAFGWVHAAAHALGSEKTTGSVTRCRLGGLLGAMATHRESVGTLSDAVDHFLKVSRSYWPGSFACYDVKELPRTNSDLERAFGSHRYHERRATGRKGASPSLVLRGAAKLVAGLATRQREVTVSDLAGADRGAWRQLRAELETRRERRVERWRFRQKPDDYLKALENKLIQSRLPA